MTLARAARRRRNVFTRIMDCVLWARDLDLEVKMEDGRDGDALYYDSCAERKKIK